MPKNERGHSWPEAMLSLLIIMLIFGSLLPLASALHAASVNKKQAASAAETAYQAAIHFKRSSQTAGSRIIEKAEYRWVVAERGICVNYETLRGEQMKCIDINSD